MCTGKEPEYVHGGRTWVWGGGLQACDRLPMNTMTVEITSNDVNSQLGVPVCAVGVAQVKVNSEPHVLKTACQLFLGEPMHVIEQVAHETLEGHQRAIIGNMQVEEMFRDKVKFSEQVLETASTDMLKLGLHIVSYTLKSLTDNNGYLKALGKTEIAQTQSRQRISEAQNLKDSDIKEAEAMQLQKIAEFEAEAEKAKAKIGLELQQAENMKDIGKQTAKADLAQRLQDAITRQQVVEQEMQVKVVERQREIKVQDEEIKRICQQLESTVIKPSEANAYSILKKAEADRNRVILEAEAEADAVRLRGEAEAFAILEKARAEAEQLKKRAEAFKQYEDAALIDLVLKVMPQVAAEIAGPLNNINKITMLSSGDGEVGAAKMTQEVLNVMEALPSVVRKLTGVDISKELTQLTRK